MNIKHIFLLSPLLLISCTDNTDTPSQVAEKYWHAVQHGDTQAAKQFISVDSQVQYDEHINSLANTSINNFVVDVAKTTATTIINPDAATPGDELVFETRLVFEGNKWKIDLKNTLIPKPPVKETDPDTITEDRSKSIQKNVESIEDAMGEGLNMLNDMLREGSEEMNKSMLEAMKELNNKMKESIENMKEHRQKKQSKPSSPDESGEGLI